MISIGNAQAFWGDRNDAAARLLELSPEIDCITLDYLAEVSLSIMAIQREKDPTLGYAKDFIDAMMMLVKYFKSGGRAQIISNAGGLNPFGCAEALAAILREQGVHLKIGIVTGDSVNIPGNYVTANAYLGAKPIAEALEQGAQIVITGRVADPSLTVAPATFYYGWNWEDYDRIAGATVAGHLIECGTQVTGGFSTNWLKVPNPANIGYPIANIEDDGSCTIFKPKGTGGEITEMTIKEQLVYEIGDPANYLSPDVTASFLNVAVDGCKVFGATGKPPPDTYKVSATYRDGYKCEAMIVIYGENALEKAKKCGDIVLQRLEQQGWKLERTKIECLGTGDVVPGIWQNKNTNECVLRIAVADHRLEALECFSREIAPLVTSGPQGVTGYTTGRPKIRPVFGYKPLSIPRAEVRPIVEIMEVIA